MYKIILLLILCILSSCDVVNVVNDERFKKAYGGHEIYYSEDFNHIMSPYSLARYLQKNIRFVETALRSQVKEILRRGYGDCEDFTICYLNILYVRSGIKAQLVLVDSNKRAIEAGGRTNHAMVRMPDGTVIEPQTGEKHNIIVRYSYEFDEVFTE